METIAGPVVLTLAMLALLIVARAIFGLICRLEGFSLTHETVENDNPAIGIRYACFLLAVVFSFLGVLHPSGIGWQQDLNLVAFYGILAIGLLVVSRWINDKFILYDFNNNKEVIGEKNAAVALVEGSTYLATAFIMAGSLYGWEGGFGVAMIWFGLGQLFLIILGLLYRLFTKGIGQALDAGNCACGLSLAGFLLSGGIVLGAALSGPFTGWSNDLQAVGSYVGLWFVFMAIADAITNLVILPGHRLRAEVMKDRNIAAGAIEAAVFITTTLFYIKVW